MWPQIKATSEGAKTSVPVSAPFTEVTIGVQQHSGFTVGSGGEAVTVVVLRGARTADRVTAAEAAGGAMHVQRGEETVER